MSLITDLLSKYNFVFAILVVGVIMAVSYLLSKRMHNTIPGAAIAIIMGLALAYFGGEKGIATFPLFSGMALLGGSMMRDFSIVSTAMGASFSEIRKTGLVGILSILLGIVVAFFFGTSAAYFMGYHDMKSAATIGAGACTFIVGPLVGTALGASSAVIAQSIAIGVLKSILITILTPFISKRMGLNDPQTAMIYGGLIGTTMGVSAGLAATDPKLVPYGALTATFYLGIASLLCPSLLYYIATVIFE